MATEIEIQHSRFGVVETPQLQPGVDWITRSPNGPFIDTGVDLGKGVIDRGRIYLSKDSVSEMAEQLGLFTDLREALSQLRTTSDLDIHNAYDRGYADAVQENHASRIHDAVRDLGVLAGQLLDYARTSELEAPQADAEALGDSVGDAVPAGPDESVEPVGDAGDDEGAGVEVAGPGGGERPAGVSANPGDGARPRL